MDVNPTVQLIEDLVDRALGRADRPTTVSPAVTTADLERHLAAIEMNARVDEMPQPVGRYSTLKRLILKLSSFVLVRQRTVNLASAGVASGLIRSMDEIKAEMAHESKRQAGALAGIEPRLRSAATQHRDMHEETVERVRGLEMQLAAHEALVAEMRARINDVEATLVLESSRRHAMERSLVSRLAAASRPNAGDPRIATESAGDLEAFGLHEMYERFESWFRPSDATLRQRFEEYVPLLAEATGQGAPVLDLGAGRGELLLRLRVAGVDCYGVDSNQSMVDRALASGLDVRREDLLEHLRSLRAESIGAICAIHVAEHLPPELLLDMLTEALRVLIPGGALVLETPNPTNLVIGAASFHNDPTHVHPITPDYLSFVCKDRGFAEVETRFLHPFPEYELELGSTGSVALDALLRDLQWALKGPQDFAVVARRPGGR